VFFQKSRFLRLFCFCAPVEIARQVDTYQVQPYQAQTYFASSSSFDTIERLLPLGHQLGSTDAWYMERLCH